MKNEIIKHLKKEGANRWLLTEPHLLYLETEGAENYLQAMENPQYASGFHSETVKIIASRVDSIIGSRNHVCLIDLGPGYPDKALPIARHCKEKHIQLDYVPVDINKFFLNIAIKEMGQYANNIAPIHALFAECADKIPPNLKKEALVMMGLTFMNFPSVEVLPLMKKIGGKGAKALIATEILNGEKSITKALQRYKTPEAKEVAFGTVKALGLTSSEVEYIVEFNSGRIEMSFLLRKALKNPNLPIGSRIVTAVSYRYTENELRKSIQPYFDHTDFYWAEDKTTVVGILS